MTSKTENTVKGRAGEALAAHYLCTKGHRLLSRNYKKKTGEIDLITKQGDTVVFTEVKLRRTLKFGSPAQAVDYRKQQRIIKTALWYLQEKNLFDYNVRFDIIEILGDPSADVKVNHIENAFLMQE
ncbi:MAG: YraN family protein [Eubacterium sp.]